MKKLFLLAAAMIAAFAANAQYISKGENIISGTVGIGNTVYYGSYTNKIPPISLSYEYGLVDDAFDVQGMSLGLGGVFAFTSAKYQYGNLWSKDGKPVGYKYSSIILAAKAYVHYDILALINSHVDNLDTYAALTFGYNIGSSRAYGEWIDGDNSASSVSGYVYGFQIGARYWFTDTLAANVELGYGLSYLNLGVSYKF